MAIWSLASFQSHRNGSAAPSAEERVNGIDCSVAVDTCSRAPADACSTVLPYETENVRTLFSLGKEIGRGSYGIVRECLHKETGQAFACKVIQKKHLGTIQDRQVVAREVGLMQLVTGHPNIVALEGAYEDEDEISIVMEFCNGGELYHHILSHGKFPEPDAAAIFVQLVGAIAYCHSRGVVHRDVKPENILFHNAIDSLSADMSSAGFRQRRVGAVQVKIADFGLGVLLPKGKYANARIGSLMYEAPEVVCGKDYDSKADVWSLGVILHALLAGTLPFIDPDQRKLARKICEGVLDLRFSPWPFVSPEAKALIRRLLVVNPSMRPSAAEILQDPWLLKHCGPPAPATPPRCIAEPMGRSVSGDGMVKRADSGHSGRYSLHSSVDVSTDLELGAYRESPAGAQGPCEITESHEYKSFSDGESRGAGGSRQGSFMSAVSDVSALSFGSRLRVGRPGKAGRRAAPSEPSLCWSFFSCFFNKDFQVEDKQEEPALGPSTGEFEPLAPSPAKALGTSSPHKKQKHHTGATYVLVGLDSDSCSPASKRRQRFRSFATGGRTPLRA